MTGEIGVFEENSKITMQGQKNEWGSPWDTDKNRKFIR